MKSIILCILGTLILIAAILCASICFGIGCYLEGVAIILAALAVIYLLFRFSFKKG